MRASGCRLTKAQLQQVPECRTLQQYQTPCGTRGCIGHFTRCGDCILPPARLVQTGDRPDIAGKAVIELLQGKLTPDEYEKQLRTCLNGNEGLLRNGSHKAKVHGSLRTTLVVAPECPHDHILIPRSIADNLVILCDGVESRAKDCVWCVGNRPPTIYRGSIRPFRVLIWDGPSIGMHPDHTAEAHADFDGDEYHIFFITRPDSVRECERWRLHYADAPLLDQYTAATGREKHGVQDWPVSSTAPMDVPRPWHAAYKVAGCDADKEAQFTLRLHAKYDAAAHRKECHAGMKAVMDQQLPLGSLGHTSRIARVVCSELQSSGSVLRMPGISLQQHAPIGMPAVTAASLLCAALTQRALDAHRRGRAGTSLSRVILSGCENHTCASLVLQMPSSHGELIQTTDLGDVTFILCSGDLCQGEEHLLVGTTSPLVLTRMMAGGATMSHCIGLHSRACEYLFACMGLRLFAGEVVALSAVVCGGIQRGHLYPLCTPASAESWFTRTLASYYTSCVHTGAVTGEWSSVSLLGPAGALANTGLLPSLAG